MKQIFCYRVVIVCCMFSFLLCTLSLATSTICKEVFLSTYGLVLPRLSRLHTLHVGLASIFFSVNDHKVELR